MIHFKKNHNGNYIIMVDGSVVAEISAKEYFKKYAGKNN